MYTHLSPRADDNATLAGIACRAFVGLSVTLAVVGCWAKGWLPGVLLTIAMAVMVYLLSISLGRLVAALGAGAWRIAGQTVLLATGFVSIEAALNHIGLAHLNAAYSLAPEAFVWPACWFISLVNVFATDTFTCELSAGDTRPSQEHTKRPPTTTTSNEERLPQWIAWRNRSGGASDPQTREAVEHIRRELADHA